MGVVYSAFDEQRELEVALKLLLIHGDRKAAIRRFFRGARLARSVRHKHIVGTLDFGLSPIPDDSPFLVMELVRGVPLTSFMDGGSRGRSGRDCRSNFAGPRSYARAECSA